MNGRTLTEEEWEQIRTFCLNENIKDVVNEHPEWGVSSSEISIGFRRKYGQPISNYKSQMRNTRWESILTDLKEHGDVQKIVAEHHFYSADLFRLCLKDKTGKTLEEFLKSDEAITPPEHKTPEVIENDSGRTTREFQRDRNRYGNMLFSVEKEIERITYNEHDRFLAVNYARAIANLSDHGMGSPRITSKTARLQLRGFVEKSVIVSKYFPRGNITRQEEEFLKSIEGKILRCFHQQ